MLRIFLGLKRSHSLVLHKRKSHKHSEEEETRNSLSQVAQLVRER